MTNGFHLKKTKDDSSKQASLPVNEPQASGVSLATPPDSPPSPSPEKTPKAVMQKTLEVQS